MEHLAQLKQYGLFDDKVPRYTSYPPANQFTSDAGLRYQKEWLIAVPDQSAVSVYVHIPFCRRLCWFCACRTQGTQSMRPVDSYIQTLIREIANIRENLPQDIAMARLHLGGGTPTILPPETMSKLLDALFAAFKTTPDFEFSVEIDPTDAAPELLETLAAYNMSRASIGVQDFAPHVQEAIGRQQTPEQTRQAVNILRDRKLKSLNVDLLYGLPFQSQASLENTLNEVLDLRPDRIALYGYAHVPWMSKRQVMIDSATLPDTMARYRLSEFARKRLVSQGYEAIGIDHFALPTDSLAKAHGANRLRRNFQGYTDDTAETLIGFGASAISRFAQGYSQNATATSAYLERIENKRFAGVRGYVMTDIDRLIALMIEELMCTFRIDGKALARKYPMQDLNILHKLEQLALFFADVCAYKDGIFEIAEGVHPLARIIAKKLDSFSTMDQAHSMAI